MSGIIRKEDMHESFWQEEVSNPNLLINGDFQVWQRGNIINCKSGVQYAADRWALWCGNDGSIFENKLWYADWTVTGNDNLIQIIEMPYRIIGFDLTFSAQMRIPKGESVIVRIGYDRTGSVTDENNFVYDETVFVGTGEFKYYNFKINKDKNNSSYCKVVLKTALTGTISLANLKLEVGTNATKFISRLYGEELALCKRYYEKNDWCSLISPVTGSLEGFDFQVEKRSIPTVTFKTLTGQTHIFSPWYGNSGFSDSENIVLGTTTRRVNYIHNLGDEIKQNNIYLTSWEANAEFY